MTSPYHTSSSGPFAQTRYNIDTFCHNLFLSYTIHDCVQKLFVIEQEYEQAILSQDKKLADQKRLQIKAFNSSLQLTAHIFEDVDEILS